MKHRSSLVRLFKSLADDRRLTVLVTLSGMDGATANELADVLAIHPSRARHYLYELKWGGLVEQRRDGRGMRWFVSDRLPVDLLHAVLRRARETEPKGVRDAVLEDRVSVFPDPVRRVADQQHPI